jgi:hypothetical protein
MPQERQKNTAHKITFDLDEMPAYETLPRAS